MRLEIVGVAHRRHGYPAIAERFSEYIHDCHVVAMHTAATGRYVLGSEEIRMTLPLFCVLAAGEIDANGLTGQDDAYWCLFNSDEVKSQPGGLRIAITLDRSRILRSHQRLVTHSQAENILALFRRLHLEWRRPDLPARLRATATLAEILAAWSEQPTDSKHDRNAVHLFRNLIDEHIDDPSISLEMLAKEVRLSVDYLSLIFRRQIGLTPVEYRTRSRMSLAQELLMSSTLNVAEIALKVGYADANYFARAFRNLHGTTPTAFARKNRLHGPHSNVALSRM